MHKQGLREAKRGCVCGGGGCPLAACLHEVWWWGLEGGGGVYLTCAALCSLEVQRGGTNPHTEGGGKGGGSKGGVAVNLRATISQA